MKPSLVEFMESVGVPLAAPPRVEAFDDYVAEACAKWEVLEPEDIPKLLLEYQSQPLNNFADILLKLAAQQYLEQGPAT